MSKSHRVAQLVLVFWIGPWIRRLHANKGSRGVRRLARVGILIRCGAIGVDSRKDALGGIANQTRRDGSRGILAKSFCGLENDRLVSLRLRGESKRQFSTNFEGTLTFFSFKSCRISQRIIQDDQPVETMTTRYIGSEVPLYSRTT